MSAKRLGYRLASHTLVVTALAAAPTLAFGQSAENFFKTATLTMDVASGAGGGYDATARVVARNMARYLPGNPNIVVKNMPGAAGVLGANFLYNNAPKDGSAILAAANAPLMLPLFNSSKAHYDPRKFEWIGSTDKQQAVCLTWHTSPIKTLADATKREVTVAATGVAAGPGIYPKILNTLFGTKFKVIAGYDTGGMRLAMEKGEVEGICGLAWQTWKLTSPDWIRDKKLHVLTQFGLEKNAELPDVPLAIDQMKTPEDKAVLELVVLAQEFGRPFLAPPGAPPDRMALYRKAFQAMLKDKEFLAESAKQRMSIEPLDDKQIQALLARAYAAPQAIKDRAAVFAAQ
jgi:tripartite-type tricarboxylate transporter receptor subunit TctC